MHSIDIACDQLLLESDLLCLTETGFNRKKYRQYQVTLERFCHSA